MMWKQSMTIVAEGNAVLTIPNMPSEKSMVTSLTPSRRSRGSNKALPASVAGLVRHNGVQLAMAKARLVDAQAFSYIARLQHPALRMWALLPRAEPAQVLLIDLSQILSIDFE